MASLQPAHCLKIAVVGSRSVGKSKTITKFISNQNDEEDNDDYFKVRETVCGAQFHLDLENNVGQEEYTPHRVQWLGSADAYLLVSDCTSMQSLSELNDWIQLLRRVHDLDDGEELKSVPVVMTLNKVDLVEPEQATITKEAFLKAAQEMLNSNVVLNPTVKQQLEGSAVPCFETSAEKGLNIRQEFIALCIEHLKKSASAAAVSDASKKTSSSAPCIVQ